MVLGRYLNAAELCFQHLLGNRDELAIAVTKFHVVFCAETKLTSRRYVWELLLPDFKAQTLLLRGARPNGFGIYHCLSALSDRKGSSILAVS